VSVLDASALIALLSAEDEHHDAAVAIVEREFESGFMTSALTLAESLVAAVRAGREQDALDIFRPLELHVLPLEEVDAVRIAQTRVTSGLKLPDAVILATAVALGSPIVTFDRMLAGAAARAGIAVISG